MVFFSNFNFSDQGFWWKKKKRKEKAISRALLVTFQSPHHCSEMVLWTIEESQGRDNDNQCSFHQCNYHVHQPCYLHSSVKLIFLSCWNDQQIYFIRHLLSQSLDRLCFLYINYTFSVLHTQQGAPVLLLHFLYDIIRSSKLSTRNISIFFTACAITTFI